MGIKSAMIKTKLKNQAHNMTEYDDPYSNLAASIIIQACEDLRALDGMDSVRTVGQTVNKWEVINFFRSDWCGFLLSFQNTVTHDQVLSAVMPLAE